MQQRIVHFFSEGSRIEADYFLPDHPGLDNQSLPGIVLCHGYSGMRFQLLPDFGRIFADAGYAVLSMDYRGFGGSEGPKWRLMPLEQVEDIRNAITFLQQQAEVDAQRIGLWGTSNGGAHIAYVAGVDERVKAAVGQVGYGDGWHLFMDMRNAKQRSELLETIAADRRERVLTGRGSGADIPTILCNEETRNYFGEVFEESPEFRSVIPWESVEAHMEYRPIDVVHRIAPRALMLIGAEHDEVCRIDGYRKMFERAGEPKRFVSLPITHYEIYTPEGVEKTAAMALEWYREHL